MRFADLLRLSLSALWQQKMRAFLTTLGVVFGAFVLVFSLSLGQGVQNTIERESHHNLFLRKIIVQPAWQGSEADLPAEELRVEGDMSEEKRQRIRQVLVEQKLRFSRNGPRVTLNRERLQALRNLEHVESVTPLISQSGWAIFGKHTQLVETCSADPDNLYHRKRLVAGNYFREPDEHGVVLSEFLCYLFGITSDAEVQGLVGQKIRLEYRRETRPASLNLYLIKGDGHGPTRQETIALEKIKQQLPAVLDQLDLTANDKAALRTALLDKPPITEVYQEELPILGILRLPTHEELNGPWDPFNRHAEVLLPRQTAEEMFFRQTRGTDVGVDQAMILVDREDNVRPVLQRITDLKLNAYAPLEHIDRERFIYLLIFTTMACVAAVALLVAALGIANTMLMSVLERTREIGIFKAVGAGDGTVQLVFLIEGAFIGLMGGGVGLLLGWAGSFPADAWVRAMVSRDLKIELKESIFLFPWWLSVSVVLFAVVVTTLAAVFPARRAARINPVTALRNE